MLGGAPIGGSGLAEDEGPGGGGGGGGDDETDGLLGKSATEKDYGEEGHPLASPFHIGTIAIVACTFL